MIKKLLFLSALGLCANSFAYFDYSSFQKFDNQVSLGMNAQEGQFNTMDSNGNNYGFTTTGINLEVEKLFDIGLWLDGNLGNLQSYTENINKPAAGVPLGAYPYLVTANLKLGYNLPINKHIAVVPYFLAGKNANLTYFTAISGSTSSSANVTSNFFYTLGGGVHFDFPINKYVDVYLDQLFASNQDQTGNFKTTDDNGNTINVNASNTQITTTIGTKVNVVSKLQLGFSAFYTTYNDYNQSSLDALSNINETGNGGAPKNAVGDQVSVGFTFE